MCLVKLTFNDDEDAHELIACVQIIGKRMIQKMRKHYVAICVEMVIGFGHVFAKCYDAYSRHFFTVFNLVDLAWLLCFSVKTSFRQPSSADFLFCFEQRQNTASV